MTWVSVLGLLTLLGIAWAMSYHRKRVSPRTVLWGLGMQFLFAVIILREDDWSFVGMGVLALLIITYLLRKGVFGLDSIFWVAAVALALGGWVGVLSGIFLPGMLGWIVLALLVFLPVTARLRWWPVGRRFGGVLLVAFGVTYLMVNGMHGQVIFGALSEKVAGFLALSDYGAKFLFGNLADSAHFFTGEGATWPGFGFQFAFKVLPTIIFFGAFMAVLYYLGLMQKVIEALAHFMRWTLATSGAETLSCSANIFVGQTEAPLLVKPFLKDLTRSELLTVMVGGFATIAGGVLAGYIAMGVPAQHLIAASVMAAPGALMIGKLIYPETEHSLTAGDVQLPEIESGGNVIEAATNGITDGFKLALNVGAMLLGFIALIAVVDLLLNFLDGQIDGRLLGGPLVPYPAETIGLSPAVSEHAGYFPGSLRTLFGTLLRPLAWLVGVPWEDSALVGSLLGIKLSLNEFVAYSSLSEYIKQGAMSPRAETIATYALCGFANFSSIGIQIGGIAALAPERRGELAKVGLKAMFGGAIVSLITATIAGILIG